MQSILLLCTLLLLSNSFALSLLSPDETKSVTSEGDAKKDEVISTFNVETKLKKITSATDIENIDGTQLEVESQGHENESERQTRAYGRYGRYGGYRGYGGYGGGFYRPYYGGGGYYGGYYPQYYGGYYGAPYYGGGFYNRPYYGGFYGRRRYYG